VTVRVHAFLRLRPPRWAFSSLGPCPHQGSFPQKSGCHDHIPLSLRTTCRTAAASPRRIRRSARAQIIQAAGHAVIWGGTLGMRRDAQGARDGELSVPRRRWPVCAIDHRLKNEPRRHASDECRGRDIPFPLCSGSSAGKALLESSRPFNQSPRALVLPRAHPSRDSGYRC